MQDDGSLAVGCLDGGLKFWQVDATQAKLVNQRQLEYDPLSVDYFNNGECIVTGGSDRCVVAGAAAHKCMRLAWCLHTHHPSRTCRPARHYPVHAVHERRCKPVSFAQAPLSATAC